MTLIRKLILFALMTGPLAPGRPLTAETLSFYGSPGLVDMPTAYHLSDGEIVLSSAYFGATLRNTFTFQIAPRLMGSFRYSWIQDFDDNGKTDRYDRSFDLAYQIFDETAGRPALAVGLRDFGGTGIYSSEYLVASKQITPALGVTGGIGWGRLAGRNSFASPFGFIDERFETRPNVGAGGIDKTGQLDFGAWFRGDAAGFAGMTWAVTDRVTLTAEYSPDLYPRETANGVIDIRSPYNFGASYRFDNGATLGAYSLYGTDIGLRYSLQLDPAAPRGSIGVVQGLRPLVPRNQIAAASWADDQLARSLREQGFAPEQIRVSGGTASVRVENERYLSQAQAVGRAARTLANRLPPDVETIEITLTKSGLPLSTTTLRRRDLEQLEFALDGSWQSLARAQIRDAAPAADAQVWTPRFAANLSPYSATAYFDPDSPLRLEIGAQARASYTLRPGVTISGQVRQALGGNLADATRRSNSILPHVRSDSFVYAAESEREISYLTGEYLFRPGNDLFGRVTAGYLELMYGGVSAEVLWHAVDSRLALGAELNYVRQRDFDGGLGFQDYEIVTGHGSAYYDFGNGYHAQLDLGRYLAGDWGGTLTLDRKFNNGFKIGAFATLTDVPFEDFGEGSFDKGIRVEVPLTWLSGQPSRQTVGTTIRPVLRDGGARLAVRNRLYGLTQDTRAPRMGDEWGLFWR